MRYDAGVRLEQVVKDEIRIFVLPLGTPHFALLCSSVIGAWGRSDIKLSWELCFCMVENYSIWARTDAPKRYGDSISRCNAVVDIEYGVSRYTDTPQMIRLQRFYEGWLENTYTIEEIWRLLTKRSLAAKSEV